MTDLSMPVSLEDEVAVLGAMVGAGKLAHELVAMLRPDDFYRTAHRLVFEAVASMLDDQVPVDTSSVLARLADTGRLAEVGGTGAVHEMVQQTSWSRPLATHHAARVVEHARRRRVIATAGQLARTAADRTVDVDATVGVAVDELLSDGSDRGTGIVTASEVYREVLDRVTVGTSAGASTGWPELDMGTAGAAYTVVPGFLTVVTGIPGHGKSQWLDNLMVNLARTEGWRFAIFSPENTPPARHVVKLAAVAQGRPLGPHDVAHADPAGSSTFDRALGWVDEHFVWLDDRDATVGSILARARLLARTRDIRGLVIDPWNELEHAAGSKEREDLYISEVLTQIRRLARHEQIHVWIVAHPKTPRREPQTDTLYLPVGTDGISGGAKWHDKADAILSIWRDKFGERRDPRLVDIHVLKIREDGEWGRVASKRTLVFDPDTRRYRAARQGELATQQEVPV